MAITTYDELQASLASWLHRSDLAAQILDFVALAEADMNTKLDSRSMETRVLLTATAGNAYVELPADMVEMRRLVLHTDPAMVLKYASPDQIDADYPLSSSSRPAVFAVIGSEIQLAPIPDSNYLLELTYQQRIPALSGSNATNWLLTKYPNAYLYGALCAAQPYIVNDARLPTFQAMYTEAVKGINSVNWYSGSTLRVRAR